MASTTCTHGILLIVGRRPTQTPSHHKTKGYSDDRDLAPGESIAFGFIVSHAQEMPNITPTCIVENAVVPKKAIATTQDSDIDGVVNAMDACPTTAINSRVNTIGCSEQERDQDKDGIINAIDQCPYSAAGIPTDRYGCNSQQYEAKKNQNQFSAILAKKAKHAESLAFCPSNTAD